MALNAHCAARVSPARARGAEGPGAAPALPARCALPLGTAGGRSRPRPPASRWTTSPARPAALGDAPEAQVKGSQVLVRIRDRWCRASRGLQAAPILLPPTGANPKAARSRFRGDDSWRSSVTASRSPCYSETAPRIGTWPDNRPGHLDHGLL